MIKFDLLRDDLNKLKNLNNYSHFIFCHGGNNSLDNIELNWKNEKKIYYDGTKKIISKLSKYKKKIIFISSDAVFDGKKGNYREKSLKNPINFYGKFKNKIENYIIKSFEDYLIIRISKVFTYNKKENHFLSEIYKNIYNKHYKYIYDEYFSPIELNEFCDSVLKLINKDCRGIYHLNSINKTSRFVLAKAILNNLKIKNKIFKVSMNKLNLNAKRGLKLHLNSKKYDKIFEIKKKTTQYYINKFLSNEKS